jgi:hypothetical protein
MAGNQMSGDLQIIKIATGERLTIAMDGSELRDQVSPPSIEWCDRGEHYANKINGSMTGSGASELWICLDCQRK